MQAQANSIFRKHPHVSLMRMAGEGLMVIPGGSEQVVLNDVGTRLVEEMDGKRTLAEIARVLAEEYDAPPQVIENDLLELTADLLGRGAVEVVG